ncbi:hypothetical protein, partial [Kaarinaea lacus]
AVSRNKLVGILLSELVTMFIKYERGGLAPFLSEWEKMDGFAGHRVQLKMHDKTITGIACGIDSDGSLKLDIDSAIRTYHSGEVSLRPAQ